MIKNILHKCLVVILCQTLAYAPLIRAGQLSLPSGDLVAPEITQETYVQSVAPDSDHTITVKVTDDVGVKQVTLFYRVIGESNYKRRTMQKVGQSDDFLAKVNADEIRSPGIEYYIQAMDLVGNTLLHGYEFSPLSVTIDADAAQPDLAESEETPMFEPTTEKEKKGISKWVWIGLGALVVGAVAAGGGSSGGDSAPPPDGDVPTTGTLTITGTTP
jgi:hypothetical protein